MLTRHFINKAILLVEAAPDWDTQIEDYTYSTPPPVHTNLKPHSTFYPTHIKRCHIESFFSLVAKEFRAINHNLKIKLNITHEENLAIKSLSANQNIIINHADKGGWVVVLDRKGYLE